MFHDDQHATAVVILAGLINSLKIAKKLIEDIKIVIAGAGASGIATARLLLSYGVKSIIMTDSKGVIYQGRKENMNDHKVDISRETNREGIKGRLADAMAGADVFIGLSKGKTVSAEMISSMASDSIVFALANPEPEIMPDLAKNAGAFIIATGRGDFPNQINNVLAFPGIFRGLLDSRRVVVDDSLKIAAAKAIAGTIDPAIDKIIPSVFDKNVHKNVADAVRNLKG